MISCSFTCALQTQKSREVIGSMASQKLFGNSSAAKFRADRPAGSQPKKSKKTRSRLRPVKILLSVLLVLEVLYCVAVFSQIPWIVRLRNMYIETAMSTMSHQWLATAFIPQDIVDEVVARRDAAREAQAGVVSTWEVPGRAAVSASTTAPAQTAHALTAEQEAFFDLYWEIDPDTMLDYVQEHPEVVAGGWDQIQINEAGLDDEGTTIRTTMGEQVLAVNVPEQILLLRVSGTGYRGVLAVAKDPAALHLYPSSNIGGSGEHAGTIAQRHGGILAMTGSGFIDEGGTGNGGTLAGACMCDGEAYGKHFTGWGYKRIELRTDDRLYITDAYTDFSEDATDAVEFMPALIVDGSIALEEDTIFTEMNPRACLGQSSRGEILMLVIEGRLLTSAGTDAMECTEIMARHDCAQAMNLDGGTSAIMWYDGAYITRCSNTSLAEGRYLPNAWVYGKDAR